MSEIKKPFYIEISLDHQIIFSANTKFLTEDEYLDLWRYAGKIIYRGLSGQIIIHPNQLVVRMSTSS
jgi:hypothetical protein